MAGPVLVALRLPRMWLMGLTLGCAAALAFGWAVVHAPHPAAPLGPLAGRRIVVDAGHGGIDAGCFHGDLKEKDINLAVARRLGQLLQQHRALVRLTRTEDTALDHLNDRSPSRHRRDLWARVEMAVEHRAELLVSIHTNYARSPSLRGAVAFYRPRSEEGQRLARLILKELAAVAPGNQNAALPGDFFLLRHLPMPAVLVEVGFLSNPEERARLTEGAYQQQLAEAILRGILAFYDYDRPEPPGSPAAGPEVPDLRPGPDEHGCGDGPAYGGQADGAGGGPL